MKNFKYIYIVGLLTVLMGCHNEDTEWMGKQEEQLCVLRTCFEEVDDTGTARSMIDYNGRVYWTKADAIGAFGEIKQNVKFEYAEDNDSNGVFKGVYDEKSDPIQFAFFPYDVNTAYADGSLTFSISTEQVYSSENMAPMIGLPINEHTLKFHQTGGVLQLKWRNLPEEAVKVKIIAAGRSPFLSGKARIDNVKDARSSFKIVEGQKELTYVLKNKEDKLASLLFVPLQVGEYEQLKVVIATASDKIMQQRSLSNVTVSRGKVIRTPQIDCGNKLEYMTLDEKLNEKLGFDCSIITSREWGAGYVQNEDKSTRFFYADLNAGYRNDRQGMMHVVKDSLDRVIGIATDDLHLSISYKDQQMFDVLLATQNGISEVNGCKLHVENVTSRINTRAGVREAKFFQTLNEVAGILGIVKDVVQGRWVALILQKLYNKCMEKYGLEPVVDVLEIIGMGPIDRVLFILSSAEHYYNTCNRRLYKLLCGNLSINTLEPKVIGNKLQFGYKVSNFSSVPKSLKGNEKITRVAQLYLFKVPNGKGVTDFRIVHGVGGMEFGRKDVETDGIEKFEVPFEKGYTYFISSTITLTRTTVHSDPNSSYYGQEFVDVLFYDGDIKYKATNAIQDLKIKSINCEEGGLIFDFYLYPKIIPPVSNAATRSWWVEFFYNGKRVKQLPVYPDDMPLRKHVKLKIDVSQMNLDVKNFKATTNEKWKAVSFYECAQAVSIKSIQSEPIDLNLVYEEKPSIYFLNPKVGVSHILYNESRANDDDTSAKYKTEISYKLGLNGSFWMKRYDAKSDVGGVIYKLSNPRHPRFDEEIPYFYYWIYSEAHPISPKLWVEATLLDGSILRSANELHFSGHPIDKVTLN